MASLATPLRDGNLVTLQLVTLRSKIVAAYSQGTSCDRD